MREDLSGYDGAYPVRIGNGAFDQRQNDVFGAALDSVLLHSRRSQRIPRRLWPLVQAQAECATAVWRQPDQGIWEARGKPRQYVSSKLMCWVALDRAARLANIRGEAALSAGWAHTAAEIKSDILEHGVDGRGVLRQHYETDALDAATLLAAIFGFLPGDDARLRATVLAVEDELTEQGYVLRYRTEETDDGLSGKEGSFLICSFWLVSALAIIGEPQRARHLMERLVKVASPLGLYAEEFDAETRRHLGISRRPSRTSHWSRLPRGSSSQRSSRKWPGDCLRTAAKLRKPAPLRVHRRVYAGAHAADATQRSPNSEYASRVPIRCPNSRELAVKAGETQNDTHTR